MSEQALSAGVTAFKAGFPRTANPFDPSGEDWMCWRDGFDQAKAVADRADGSLTIRAIAAEGEGAAPAVL